MSSEGLYRALVPAHNAVPSETVIAWLAIAGRRLLASAFGNAYPEAAIWWCAHQIELTPGSGAGGDTLSPESPERHKRQRARSARRAAPPGSDEWYRSTQYGCMFLDIRDSRAASAPGLVGPGG